MKKFIINNAIFMAGVILLSAGMFIYKVTTENPYSVLFHLKNKQLATHANTSKIVILGGSNTRYGFDSEYLQAKMGRPVINMGITLHLGLSYYLNWSKLYLKEGDIVILSPEYRLTYSQNGLYGSDMLMDIAPDNEHFIKYIFSNYKVLKNQLLQAHLIISKSVSNLIKPQTNKAELLASHNQAGDAIGNHGKSTNYAANTVTIQKPSSEYYKIMKEFAAYCVSKNIKVYMSFPPTSKELLDIKVDLEQIVKQHKKELPEVIVLNLPQDTFYPDDLFYDSSYHLNTAGKTIHTQKIHIQLEAQIYAEQAMAGMYTINNTINKLLSP